MKKIVLLCAAMMAAFSFASAQTVKDSKLSDNWFLGVDGGAYTKTTHSAFLKNARPMFGIKVGRYLTPVFGLRADAQFMINGRINNLPMKAKTAIDYNDITLDGLFNLNNLFSGYLGEPRPFEVVAVAGFGWFHGDGSSAYRFNKNLSKFGMQFNFNLGKAKDWQINIEPDLCYYAAGGDGDDFFNINRSYCQLTAGLTYKFGCSNGTHNFVLAKEGYSQSEMDALNAKINDLRKEVGDKDNTISGDQNTINELQQKLAACESAPKQLTTAKAASANLAPVVIFDQGKSVINPAQAPSIKMIATYLKNHPKSKLTIKGYASPEGNAEINKKLSEDRANAVKNVLVKKYKINANRLTAEGLGATSEVFDESDWNRVCTFIEK